MYTVNGVELDSYDTFGWYMLRRSQVLNDLVKQLTSVSVPGRPGVLSGIPAFANAHNVIIVMRCKGEALEALYTLFSQNGGVGTLELTDNNDRVAVFELASIESQGINAKDELITVSITIRFPTAEWRATSVTTQAPASVVNPIETFDILDGISSEIRDMDIFIGGDFDNFSLEDVGSGSWLHTTQTWPALGDGLLYVGSTGQAFVASSAAPWTPMDDASEFIDVSGGGGFRITPFLIAGNPSDRIARLELTTTSQTDLTFGFRATNAYVLRNGEV